MHARTGGQALRTHTPLVEPTLRNMASAPHPHHLPISWAEWDLQNELIRGGLHVYDYNKATTRQLNRVHRDHNTTLGIQL